jgi:DNA processing protein
MYELPAPWALAARFSGRFDPWPVLDALGGTGQFSRADATTLARAGLPLDIAARLEEMVPLRLSSPPLLAGAADYPVALRGVVHAPPVLFVEGDPAALQLPMVAVVGSRSATLYGRRMAAMLASAICRAGGVVVSGMARGVDFEAHKATFGVGRSVGVAAFGLEARTSMENRALREAIVRGGGAVVSEFLPRSHPEKHTFLQRNRVIAGLSRATVIVEAGHRSGALSTARHALAQGREVLALPGPVGEGNSEGCLDLIQEGATIIRGPATVLEAAGLLSQARANARQPSIEPRSAALLRGLVSLASVDELTAATGMTTSEVLCHLALLEMDGLVAREPGQRFVLVSG